MAIRAENIFAGISAAGVSGAELVWFGQQGAVTAPTDATSALVTTVVSEVQTVTLSGTPTGGTFSLSFLGQTTAAIAYNAAASAVQAALVALSTIGAGGVTVTGTGPWVCTFAGVLGGQNLSTMTANGALLTGGTTPSAAVAETTPGMSGWLSAGLISEDGVSEDTKETSKEVRAFALQTAVRKIVTASDVTVKTAMLEVNKVSKAVRARLPLNSVVVTNGAFLIKEGQFRVARYAMVVHAVDGLSAQRTYYPSVEVTDRDGKHIKNGEVSMQGVTLTAYPDSAGWSSYEYNLIDGLT